MTSTNSKRRRTDYDDDCVLDINNLPDALLTGIVNYLADPSRALFAIALTTPTTTFTQPTERSNAIISGGN